MKQADPLLKMLRVGSSAVKLVETAMSLNNSQDPEQRSHTYSFMKTAIKELDDNFSNDGLKNHNNGSRVDGSYQSSYNSGQYPGTANDSPDGEHSMNQGSSRFMWQMMLKPRKLFHSK